MDLDLFGGFKIYENSEGNERRFLLGEGKSTDNLLMFIGINPNTASDQQYDLTTKKVRKFSLLNGFTGWILVNICPHRSLSPDLIPVDLKEEHYGTNRTLINNAILEYKIKQVCCCWGNSVLLLPSFNKRIRNIYNSTLKCNHLSIGPLTKIGHPKHPSRLGYNTPLVNFNFKDYLYQIDLLDQ